MNALPANSIPADRKRLMSFIAAPAKVLMMLQNRFEKNLKNAKTLLTTGTLCLISTSAWAGPYPGGQFALYGLYVCLYLVPPAVLILTAAKTVLWCRLPLEPGQQQYYILKATGAFFISCWECVLSGFAAAAAVTLASLVPAISETDRTTGIIALIGWSLFFVFLGIFDARYNRRLLNRHQLKNPGATLTEKHIYIGPVIMILVILLLVLRLAMRENFY